MRIEKITHAITADDSDSDDSSKRIFTALRAESGGTVFFLQTTREDGTTAKTTFALQQDSFDVLFDLMLECKTRMDLYPHTSDLSMIVHDGVASLVRLTEFVKDHGDLYTEEEFREEFREGRIVSSDGSGYWASESHYSRERPVFKDRVLTDKPKWATHVAWFNK